MKEADPVPNQTTSSKGRRAVVAEDDLEMRRLLVDALEREGFSVTGVADGLELLELMEALAGPPSPGNPGLPDLVVSDVVMPHCTGLTALAAIKRLGHTYPFVVITAFGDAHTHAEALRLGAAGVYDKPIDLLELRRLANQLVP